MKSYLSVIALTTLLLVIGDPAPVHADRLPEATSCEIALESSASEKIFDLKIELGRTNALSRDEFSSIRDSLDALLANATSPAAKACFSQYRVQKQRYAAWFAQQAGSVTREAKVRLGRTCGRQTDMFIRSHRNRIDSEVRRKHLAKAAQLATEMQKGIEGDPMIRDCEGMQKRLGVILNYYIPGIQNQAALPQVLSRLGKAHHAVRSTLDEANSALQTSGRTMVLAPISLESEEGREALQSRLAQCKTYGKTLIDIGAAADILVPSPSGESHALQNVRAFCSQAAASLETTIPKLIAHNTRFREAELLRWRRTNLKTWSMEKVFNARGRPIADSKRPGGAILWTYQAEAGKCLRIQFTPAGKKVGEETQSCPVLSSK